MASSDFKWILAQQMALGLTISEIARRHGKSRQSVNRLCNTKGVQALLEEARRQLRSTNEEVRRSLFQMGPRAIENLREILKDPRHAKHAEMTKFVLEKILPNDPTVTVSVGQKTQVGEEHEKVVTQAILKISTQLPDLDLSDEWESRVKSGPEALPRLEAQGVEDAEVVN